MEEVGTRLEIRWGGPGEVGGQGYRESTVIVRYFFYQGCKVQNLKSPTPLLLRESPGTSPRGGEGLTKYLVKITKGETEISDPKNDHEVDVQWATKVMTLVSIRNTWKQGSWLLWPTVHWLHATALKLKVVHVSTRFQRSPIFVPTPQRDSSGDP